MPNIDKKKLQEQILKDGYIIEILDDNDNVVSTEHIPPPTKKEMEELEKFKASEKIKYMSNIITCSIPKTIDLKKVKVVDDLGNEYPFTQAITAP
jgi:hypothetical protein